MKTNELSEVSEQSVGAKCRSKVSERSDKKMEMQKKNDGEEKKVVVGVDDAIVCSPLNSGEREKDWYPVLMRIRYHDNDSYRESLSLFLETISSSLLSSERVQQEQMKTRVCCSNDDQSLVQKQKEGEEGEEGELLHFDVVSKSLFECTQTNPAFAKLYELVANKILLSTDVEHGMIILFSYDYLSLFHECLAFYFLNNRQITMEADSMKSLARFF